MKEIWKDIDEIKGIDYTGLYQVSNLGRVKGLKNKHILKQRLKNNGYCVLTLCKENKPKTYLVHRLVAEAFIPNPNNYPQVNHKDEDKTNNCVDNLEWCTKEYNMNYGTLIERMRTSLTGKHLSEETKRKLSIIRKGRIVSSETKRKISEAQKKRWKTQKENISF